MKALVAHLPWANVKSDGVLCSGGDVRVKANRWLYEALESYDRRGRLCRLPKIISIIALINYKKKICGSPRRLHVTRSV